MDVLNLMFKKLILVALLLPFSVSAQESSLSELDQIEAELERSRIQKFEEPPQVRSSRRGLPGGDSAELSNISDLRALEPFGDLAVIQPRYQPKSKRFQAHLGGGMVLNDPWFNHLGLSAKGSYHFTEFFGLELAADIHSGSASASAKDLEANLTVKTSSLVQPKSYFGVHAYLVPMYGKMSLFNSRIIPFDLYFTLGAGQTAISGARTASALTYHFGAGQIFAFTRNAGFRWDIHMNMFEAQSELSAKKSSIQNVVMSLGFSYFFPEVGNR